MTDLTWLMICDGDSGTCDCADTVDVNDTVVTPDGAGTLIVLKEHTADVRMQDWPEDAATDVFCYELSDLHLTESAGAAKE